MRVFWWKKLLLKVLYGKFFEALVRVTHQDFSIWESEVLTQENVEGGVALKLTVKDGEKYLTFVFTLP